MEAIASYLCMERLVSLRQENLPVQIDEYIREHLTEALDAPLIAEHFGIGKTRLYEIAKESYGYGIAEHIRKERIEKAKALLLSDPALPVSEIAVLSGFSDYNNFITLFRKQTGYTPRQFRSL
jgi:AraC-like DNA-binding protein